MINIGERIWKLIEVFPNVETYAFSVELKETAINYLKKNLFLNILFKDLSILIVHLGDQT